ncbi:ATP synthase subunit E [Pseudooceanicola batsensis HTCC2597]|uniref:ATP synthase subunit E n=1 Tax=Pseudooceanicola batsensis (strain ATCC BAA-863 / DSM 15984 / KCTC 12145 / HTCC2597) TaxID=252305 RepID=A3TTJ3_PSEBH|nr:formate dehydrogenase subunit gamma [Pseudooceanicola batsensis]EAQ04970.1 ATP synthase subunit E [Pseudooceanicola batsensis HTCC2597]
MRPAPPPTPDDIQAVIDTERHREGALLPILHALQEAYGHIPEGAYPLLTATLGITRAELHGVVSFYHDFRDVPAGRHVVKVCRAEACQSVGANAMAATLLDRFGLDWHGTTPDGRVTIEPVYCLGLCACGPAAMVDGKLIGRADPAKLAAALSEPSVEEAPA